MTTARPDTSWKTATPLTYSCNNDDVTQLGPIGSDSDAMFEVVEISDKFLYTFSCSAFHTL